MKGIIIKLGNGFGYIKTTEISFHKNKSESTVVPEEIFFHVSALENSEFRDLKIGETVEFDIDKKNTAVGAKRVRKML